MKTIGSLVLFLMSFLVYAADIPEDIKGTEQLNSENCVSTTTDNCINNQCHGSSNISTDRDCPDTCADLAQKKCNRMRDE